MSWERRFWVQYLLYCLDQPNICRLTFLSLLLTSVITLIVRAQPASQKTCDQDAKKLMLTDRPEPQGGVPEHEVLAVPDGHDWPDSSPVGMVSSRLSRHFLWPDRTTSASRCAPEILERSFPSLGSPQLHWTLFSPQYPPEQIGQSFSRPAV